MLMTSTHYQTGPTYAVIQVAIMLLMAAQNKLLIDACTFLFPCIAWHACWDYFSRSKGMWGTVPCEGRPPRGA